MHRRAFLKTGGTAVAGFAISAAFMPLPLRLTSLAAPPCRSHTVDASGSRHPHDGGIAAVSHSVMSAEADEDGDP
jgi:hypothetical protein